MSKSDATVAKGKPPKRGSRNRIERSLSVDGADDMRRAVAMSLKHPQPAALQLPGARDLDSASASEKKGDASGLSMLRDGGSAGGLAASATSTLRSAGLSSTDSVTADVALPAQHGSGISACLGPAAPGHTQPSEPLTINPVFAEGGQFDVDARFRRLEANTQQQMMGEMRETMLKMSAMLEAKLTVSTLPDCCQARPPLRIPSSKT